MRRAFFLAFLLLVAIGARPLPVQAGDPDRYIGDTSIYSGNTEALRPNVLFIVDTSKNMSQGGGTEPYNPNATYEGSFSVDAIYQQLTSTNYQLYVPDVNAAGVCAEAVTALKNYGFYNKGLKKNTGDCSTKTNDIGNYYLGNLLNKTQSTQSEISAWAAGQAYTVGKIVKASDPNNLKTYRCIRAGTAGNTEPVWPTAPGGQVDEGEGKPKWEITATLMEVVKAVLKQAAGALREDLKLGLMTVAGNNAGGWVRAEVKRMAATDPDGPANYSAFLNAVDRLNYISSNTSQPVNETLYDAMYYFKGENDSTEKLGSGTVNLNFTSYPVRYSAPSPIDYSCQKNYVVILTTGSSTRTVTKSSCQPSAPNRPCRLSAKKLKYLKKPSIARLKPRLTHSRARRRLGVCIRSSARPTV